MLNSSECFYCSCQSSRFITYVPSAQLISMVIGQHNITHTQQTICSYSETVTGHGNVDLTMDLRHQSHQ